MSNKNPFEILGKTFEEGKEIDKKINASLESLEWHEERERVLTVLYNFYQERQKNLPIHRETGELIEKLRPILEELVPYVKILRPKWKNVKADIFFTDTDNYRQLCIIGADPKTDQTYTPSDIVYDLKNLQKNKEYVDDKNLKKFTEDYEEILSKLKEQKEKMWQIKEKIARELLKFPEFSEWKDALLDKQIYEEGKGLYNLNSYFVGIKVFETERGTKEERINFNFNDSDVKKGIEDLQEKHNITEEEWKEIKELEWSEEEKENLKNLMEDIKDYKTEAEKLKQGLLRSKNLKFKETGAELIKSEFLRAFARQSYEDYKLPTIHKERVVQEIMDGTFTF